MKIVLSLPAGRDPLHFQTETIVLSCLNFFSSHQLKIEPTFPKFLLSLQNQSSHYQTQKTVLNVLRI